MKCETCEASMVEHAHGELGPALAREVAAHLGQCGACATAYGALMFALIPVLLWVASTARTHDPTLVDETEHADNQPAPARMRNYDASSIPRIYRGVL